EVGAGARLGVALAPGDLTRSYAGQVLPLLLVGAVHDQDRPDHRHAEAAEGRGADARHLLVEDELFADGHAAAAVFLRPVRRDPTLARQRRAPCPDKGGALGVGGRPVLFRHHLVVTALLRHVLLDVGADLLAEACLFWGIAKLHTSLLRRWTGLP